MKGGYNFALALSVVGFGFSTRFMLFVDEAPNAWLHFFGWWGRSHPTVCSYSTCAYSRSMKLLNEVVSQRWELAQDTVSHCGSIMGRLWVDRGFDPY